MTSRLLETLRHRVLFYDGGMGTQIQARSLTAEDFADIVPSPPARSSTPTPDVRRYVDAMAQFERDMLRLALDACGGKVALAAQRLGISRATLYKKLAQLNVPSHN